MSPLLLQMIFNPLHISVLSNSIVYVPLRFINLSSLHFSSMPLHIGLCVVFLAVHDEMLLIWTQIPLAAYSASRLPAYLPPEICCPIHLVGSTQGWCCPPWRSSAALMASMKRHQEPRARPVHLGVQKAELPLPPAVAVIDSTTKWV